MQRWPALLFLAFATLCHAQNVTVDASTNLILGEQPSVSASLFGLTAFEGGTAMVADADYRARLAALRPGCIRYAGNLAWVTGDTPCGPDFFATPEARRAFAETLLFGSRYPTGRFLPLTRQLGAEPMCSLGGVPKWLQFENTHNPADFARWAELCAGYVGLWKTFDPDFRLVQIWNEPNADWFRDPRASDKGTDAAKLHIDMANQVARAVKAAHPDVQVGGPVLCWGPGWPPNQKGQRPWYTWDSWTLPWLEATRDTIDFFDFHVYGISPEDFAVQTSMLVNAAERIQGRRLPVWITESNYDLKPEELQDGAAIWEKRILPYARFLLAGILP
ncbi:MAG: glycosyl hydrolase, partial [Lentisphaeria bacterium]|nr:glycosyl hydrolase [Lentisphaeria bacterium]